MNSKSSDKIIERLLDHQAEYSRLLIIEGWSGSGKTTWCKQLLEHARQRRVKVGGIISPAIFEAGHKTGIDLVNVQTSEKYRLAVRGEKKPGWLELGTWFMDQRVLEWGNEILASVHDRQVVIIDEIGPLEFEQHLGLVAAFNLIDSRRYNLACVSLRPSLVETALKRWPQAEIHKLPDL